MNEMPWLDSLTPQQMHLAEMLVHKAKKEGVDPKLALALAFRESGLKHGAFEKDKEDKLSFKPLTGKSGEIGVMQVMPDTAKLHGFKPEELNNLEKNMDIGLKVLKSHLGQFNDPVMAAAAYNAGPNHPYFRDPQNSLPDTTKQYLKDIAGYGGFAPAQAASEEEAQPIPSGAAEEAPAAAPAVDFRRQLGEYGPGVGGAAVGAAVGSKLASNKNMQQGAQAFANMMRQQGGFPGAGPSQPPAGMPGAGAPSNVGVAPSPGISSGGADAGRLARGQTGTMPYNYAKAAGLTDIEAGLALDMTKQAGGVHDLTTQRREGMQKIQQLFPGEKYVENPRFGGLMTPDQGVGGGPRQSFVVQGPVKDVPPGTLMGPAAPPPEGSLRPLPPRAPIPTTAPATSLLDDAIAKLGQIAKGALNVAKSAPVAGALGGYGAATSGVEAFERGQKGDVAGSRIAGLGTLGALSAIPHPVAQGIGFGASVMSPLGLAVLDRMRKVQAQPAPPPASPEEMYQARQPAFVGQRP